MILYLEPVLSVRLLNIKVSNARSMSSILVPYFGTNEPSWPLIKSTEGLYLESVIDSGLYAGAIDNEVALGGT